MRNRIDPRGRFMISHVWKDIEAKRRAGTRSRPATKCSTTHPPQGLREIEDLAVVPSGQAAQNEEAGSVAEEVDRPIPEERVHPATVIGHERNVRPFAVPPTRTTTVLGTTAD